MRHEKETAQRGNAGGKVNHRRREDNTAAARGANRKRDFRAWRPIRIGDLIDAALAGIGGEVRRG